MRSQHDHLKVLMPVAYRADHGGLHDHVEELALSLSRLQVEVTVAGRGGPFFEKLSRLGISVLKVDFDSPTALETVRTHGPWDLIHAHPFESRAFALEAAHSWELPLIVTIHGWYSDDVSKWHKSAASLIAVTPSIGHRLSAEYGVPPQKVRVIPNQVRLKPFSRERPTEQRERRLVIASRIDKDFAATELVVHDFIRALRASGQSGWEIVLAGAGSALPATVSRLSHAIAHIPDTKLLAVGWRSKQELRSLLMNATCCIAPGRAAVDAISMGVPTILTRQIGSYALPPFGEPNAFHAGTPGVHVSGAEFFDFCSSLLADPLRFEELSTRHREIIESLYDPAMLTRQVLALYLELIP